MPKISQERRQERRDQIARAAVDEFIQHGIHSTTMANIISASGLSAGAIYTHFAGKEEIIAYVASTTVNGVLADVSRVRELDPLPDPATLLSMITGRIPRADVPPGLIVQIWAEAVTNAAIRHTANEVYVHAQDILREYFTLWLTTSEHLELSRARAEAPARARAMISVIYSHILQAALIDGHDPKGYASDLAPFVNS